MGEIRSIPAGILSAAWLDCDKYSKIYAGIFASCMKSDQSFHTGSNPLARTASNTSAGVVDGPLLQLVDRMRVSPRSRLRSGAHDRHAERHHRVAASGALAGRYGELDVLAQQAVGADQLQQVALGGRMLGIEPVLAVIRPQAREGDRILRAPVSVLQIADVQRREERLGAPVLQPDQVAHADLVDAGLAQAVGSR